MKDRVKEIRKENNLTQTEFAERVGVGQNTIARIENGTRNPSGSVVRMICREFHVSQNWLENGIEPKYIDQDESDIDVINRIMEGQSENKKKLMRILADMPDELLDKMLEYLENKYN